MSLIALTMVCSCSLYQRIIPKKEPEVTIITKPVERVIVQPIMPREIDLKEPHWYVVSKLNIDEFTGRNLLVTGIATFQGHTYVSGDLLVDNIGIYGLFQNSLASRYVCGRKVIDNCWIYYLARRCRPLDNMRVAKRTSRLRGCYF